MAFSMLFGKLTKHNGGQIQRSHQDRVEAGRSVGSYLKLYQILAPAVLTHNYIIPRWTKDPQIVLLSMSMPRYTRFLPLIKYHVLFWQFPSFLIESGCNMYIRVNADTPITKEDSGQNPTIVGKHYNKGVIRSVAS